MSRKAWNALNSQIIACERCPRLRAHCEQVAREKRRAFLDWNYWGKPVPNFGDPAARLLIVGLAPAAHGANRTGRMFTGDRSGEWVYRALHKAGFGNQPDGNTPDDGLKLTGCAITAAAHCAPPDNKPTPDELANCRPWLQATYDLIEPCVVIAFGQIAFRAAIDEAKRREWFSGSLPRFGHGALVQLADERWIIASYHPSQQNTFTGKLTEPMFDQIFSTARKLLEPANNAQPQRARQNKAVRE
jgi:uracil-DNA glycosylase family 4